MDCNYWCKRNTTCRYWKIISFRVVKVTVSDHITFYPYLSHPILRFIPYLAEIYHLYNMLKNRFLDNNFLHFDNEQTKPGASHISLSVRKNTQSIACPDMVKRTSQCMFCFSKPWSRTCCT